MSPPTVPNPLAPLLSTNSSLVLDGALATHLETLGADISGALWSADVLHTNSSLIKRTHLEYFLSGANITITASYQASLPGLIKHLNISAEEAANIVRKSVELAKEARYEYLASLESRSNEMKDQKGESRLIAGSVGPYGAFLADGSEYRGDYRLSSHEYQDFHRGRIAALLSSSGDGVDILACETLPSFSEAQALLSLIREEFSGTSAWFSFTLSPHDSTCISDGTPLSQIVPMLDGAGQVVAVGVNCVNDSAAAEALREMERWTQKPLIVYPNSGETWSAERRNWEGERVEGVKLRERIKDFWEHGARIIGGCCRTGPDDVRAIAETLQEIRQAKTKPVIVSS